MLLILAAWHPMRDSPLKFFSLSFTNKRFFRLCCTWASGRHEGKAIRQLWARLLVQLCYSSLKWASEGRRDRKSFCRHTTTLCWWRGWTSKSRIQLLATRQTFTRLWFLAIHVTHCSSLLSKYSYAYDQSAFRMDRCLDLPVHACVVARNTCRCRLVV